mmetsp:Transcript_4547/g.8523  ORF Transcript_4547/g.8523 Transcript_4547/m.8523 type:complete len:579 (-) Transcript_4547:691-2427(-)
MAAATLLRSLPKPQQVVEDDEAAFTEDDILPPAALAARKNAPPPYGKRSGFVPRKMDHYGDGGAFPECHVAQYPLGMGKDDGTTAAGAVVPVTMDAKGNVNYDSIMHQGSHSAGMGKLVQSSHNDLLPKLHEITEDQLQRPNEEEIEETRKRTEAALNKIVDYKMQAAQPKSLAPKPGEATYIKYTPSHSDGAHNSGAQHRVIRMSEMPKDPLDPPKFRHKKVPRGPGSPPVPVLHSPPRAISVKDMQDWKIPACISNWKNAKGYTIPLDKRLAADGRGLQETQINDNFAKLSEALYVAEQKAREAVETRSKIQKELMLKEKEKKEDELRALAQRARMERAGGAPAGGERAAPGPPPGGYPPPPPLGAAGVGDWVRDTAGRGGAVEAREERGARESREEREQRRVRDELREERRQERDRERRLEDRGQTGKKSKLSRDRDRDISEQVALGKAKVGGTGETMYDQRLFNQDEGIGSGFGGDDSYNVYDKGLFAEKSGKQYRPTAQGDEDGAGGEHEDARRLKTDRFKPDKGFAGASGADGAGPRHGAVQFEKDQVEADPFGLDAFLTEVKGKGKEDRRR